MTSIKYILLSLLLVSNAINATELDYKLLAEIYIDMTRKPSESLDLEQLKQNHDDFLTVHHEAKLIRVIIWNSKKVGDTVIFNYKVQGEQLSHSKLNVGPNEIHVFQHGDGKQYGVPQGVIFVKYFDRKMTIDSNNNVNLEYGLSYVLQFKK